MVLDDRVIGAASLESTCWTDAIPTGLFTERNHQACGQCLQSWVHAGRSSQKTDTRINCKKTGERYP